ncbi:MAG: hypothetical protein IPM79_33270 [Polyangiaceae bacterium]|nr:hypothetical protein [Polyangiaceae bacterium]
MVEAVLVDVPTVPDAFARLDARDDVVREEALARLGARVCLAAATRQAVLLDAAAAGRVVGANVGAVRVQVRHVEVEHVASVAVLGRALTAAAVPVGARRAALARLAVDARARPLAERAVVALREGVPEIDANLARLGARSCVDRRRGVEAVVRPAAMALPVEGDLRRLQGESVHAVGVGLEQRRVLEGLLDAAPVGELDARWRAP